MRRCSPRANSVAPLELFGDSSRLLEMLKFGSRRRPVLLTTDPGAEVDDQLVIAYLALSRQFKLLGIVTTHTPNVPHPRAQSTAAVAESVLDLLDIDDRPPVIAGANYSIDEMGNRPDMRGARFILKHARNHTRCDRLPVLVIGAATDLALALRYDETLADRILIVAMAFNSWPRGKDNWNVRNDVTAWKTLLESRAPIVVADAVVGLNDLPMTRADAPWRLHGSVGKHLSDLFTNWLDENATLAKRTTGNKDKWPTWDLATVAYLLGYTTQKVYPRPVLNRDLSFSHRRLDDTEAPNEANTITWITSVDGDALWQSYTSLLDEVDDEGGCWK